VKFRDLPGFPSLFADYAEDAGTARSIFGSVPDEATLRQRALSVQDPILPRAILCDRLMEQARRFDGGPLALANIQRLRMPQTVAIVSNLRPSLFGGPLCSFLKVVTAAKLALWLSRLGLPAVPICAINGKIRRAELCLGVTSTQGPRALEQEVPTGAIDSIPGSIRTLLQDVADALETSVENSEVLKLLESAYEPGSSFRLAWARVISKTMEPLGIVLFDPQDPGIEIQDVIRKVSGERAGVLTARAEQERRLREAGYDFESPDIAGFFEGMRGAGTETAQVLTPFLAQNLILPAAAFVMEEAEAGSLPCDQAVVAKLIGKTPVIWPRMSATLVDERSAKVMSRYGLEFDELLVEPDRLTCKLVQRGAPVDVLNGLGGLKDKVGDGMTQLAAFVNPEDKLSAHIASARRRMLYQIDKLRSAAAKSELRRKDVIRGRVSRLCTNLIPNGELQERGIASLVYLHRYSLLLAQHLFEGLDAWQFEHQLIFL
jgi:bacillithiol synthase